MKSNGEGIHGLLLHLINYNDMSVTYESEAYYDTANKWSTSNNSDAKRIYKYNGQRAIVPRNFLVGGGRARVAGVNSNERQLLFTRKVNKWVLSLKTTWWHRVIRTRRNEGVKGRVGGRGGGGWKGTERLIGWRKKHAGLGRKNI